MQLTGFLFSFLVFSYDVIKTKGKEVYTPNSVLVILDL